MKKYDVLMLEQCKKAFIRDDIKFFLDQMILNDGRTDNLSQLELQELKSCVLYAKEKGYLRKVRRPACQSVEQVKAGAGS